MLGGVERVSGNSFTCPVLVGAPVRVARAAPATRVRSFATGKRVCIVHAITKEGPLCTYDNEVTKEGPHYGDAFVNVKGARR